MSIVTEQFKDIILQLKANLNGDNSVTPENVYKEGNSENREIIGQIMDQLMLKGSHIKNRENLEFMFQKASEGKSCLILMEHYSNFDLTSFIRLIEKTEGLGIKKAEKILPIAGMKLSSDSDIVAAFSHSYSQIRVYPSKYLDKVDDPKELEERRKIATPINHAAIKVLTKEKHNGKVILVFPSGTRYREWDPETKKGVREIFSYIKTFDYVCLTSINGNLLKPTPESMEEDIPQKDMMIFTADKPVKGRTFVKETSVDDNTDLRDSVVSRVMSELGRIHTETEAERQELLKTL